MENELAAEAHLVLEDVVTTDGCVVPMDIEPYVDKDRKIIQNPVRGELVASESDANLEPYEGMEFESEEAAKTFYSAYARRVGFRVRISKYSRSRRDNSVISRRIVCSKEGFREIRVKNGGLFGERRQRQRQRAVTRVGCKAMIMVKKIGMGKWVVSKFVKEHNHGPVPPKKVEVRMAREDDDDWVDKSLVCQGDSVQEPFEGMEFDSEEAAKLFYSTYARLMGFRARISKYCRSRRDNSIISRRIVCSKEGFRELRVKKEITDEGKTMRPRVVTRIGCKAMIIVKKLSSGKWVVSRFEKEHNHALVSSKKVLHLQSHANTGKGLINSLQGAHVVPSGVITRKCSAGVEGTCRESLTVLYNQLCNEAIRYAQEGAATEDIYNVAMSALQEAVKKVAEAKRNAVTVAQRGLPFSGTNQGVTVIQGSDPNMAESKALHELRCLNEVKQAISSQELVLLQQPINYVLIPSSLLSDSSHINCSVEAPSIQNISNGQILCIPSDGKHTTHSSQGMNIINPVSILNQPLPTTPSIEGLVGIGSVGSGLPAGRKRELQLTDQDMEQNGAVQKSQRLDFVGVGQAHTTPSSGSSLISPGRSEAQLVAIPAVPVTLFMPVMGSLPATCSVATPPGTPGNSYALMATPIEALPVSARPAEASTLSQVASQQSPAAAFQRGGSSSLSDLTPWLRNQSDEMRSYTGRNPRVHAAAIAAGARIVPPKAAASLIKAVQSRIRSAGGASPLAKSTFLGGGSKPLTAKALGGGSRPCSSETGQRASMGSTPVNACSVPGTQAGGGDSERQAATWEGMELHKSGEALKEDLVEGMGSSSMVKDAGENQSLFERHIDLLDTMGDAEHIAMFEKMMGLPNEGLGGGIKL